MGQWLRNLSTKIKTTVLVATLLGAQVAGAVLPFMPSNVVSAAPICTIDTAGANDVPGQKDLTKLCVDNAGAPTTIATTFNWDETGTSGTGQSLDACNLFDTNGNGLADAAVCVSTQNDPATLQAFTTYTCTDTRQDRCTGSSAIANGTTTCTVSQQNTDPFPTGTSSPKDTQGACTIQLSTIGATAKLLDVCSYPSGQPNSDPSDCVVERASAGKLEVIKNLVPTTDNGLFNLQVDGVTKAANVGNNGTTGELSVSAGNHTVGELAGTSTTLSSYSPTISCRNLNGTGTVVASGTANTLVVPVADQSDIVCIITNTASASITIVKDAVPNGPQDFSFTATGTGVSNFSLDDDSDPALSNTKTFTGLSAGSFSFTEGAVSGWDFDNISCSAGASVQKSGTTVTITLAAGQNVSCTYTNRQRGHIVVNKVTSPVNDTTSFPISATSSTGGNITGGSSASVATNAPATYDVSQGTYAVAETVPSGWSQASNTCSNLVIDGNTPLVNGVPTVSCTITNTKLAKLKIVKAALPFSSQSFSYTTTGTGLSPFSLVDDSANTTTNQQQFVNLTPGAYGVTEQSAPGWSLTGLSCNTNNYTTSTSTVNVNLAAGQDTTCTYTNTKLGSLSGTKYEVNSNSTQVGLTGLGGWTVNLYLNGQFTTSTTTDSSGNYTFNGLLPGNYSTFEALVNGWTPIYGTNPVALGAGDTSTGNNFGNFKNASISGYKFNDLNGDAAPNQGEPHLSGWTINLYQNAAVTPTATTATDGSGNYSFTNLAPGTYTVCEVQQNGWVQTYPVSNACNSVTVALSGHDYTNTNFGNQGRGTISVVKNVDSDGNGTVDFSNVTNWNWDIDGSGNFTTGSANAQPVAAGTFAVSEVQKTDFHVSSSSCTGETVPTSPTTSLSATVSAGENVVCTFTNTRDTGALTLVKQVVNDNGGTAVASDFTLHVTQNGTDVAGSPAGGSETGTAYNGLPTGTYSVSENTPVAGYTQTSIICGGQATNQVTVTANGTSTCTITNDDIAPLLTVTKHVLNDNSGTLMASDFNLYVNGSLLLPQDAKKGGGTLEDNSVTYEYPSAVANLAYTVNEDVAADYTQTSLVCMDSDTHSVVAQPVVLSLGQHVECTITNNDIPHPGIHVVKSGPATAHEGDTVTYTFTVTNTGDTTLASTTVTDNIAGSGIYQSGDTNNNGLLDKTETWVYTKNYTISTPQVANVDNTVTACASDPAQTQVCDTDDHTLDVLHPSIHVVKSGPQYGYEGMTIGYTFVVTNTGDTTLYSVGIDDNLAVGELCDANTLAPGASTNCTAHFLIPIPTVLDVINTVTASGTDVLDRTVTDTDNHDLDVLHPSIHVAKSGPATAHEGDTVTYTFTVTNTGDIPLSSVTVTDNVAGNAVYVSGDTDENGQLDMSETWVYTKDYTIPSPQVANVVNTATACGYDPLQFDSIVEPTATCDTDNHTLDVLHPAIHVVKSGPATAYQGDHVTYTFTVTNTGDTPLGSLTVSDNVAGNGIYQSGDTNHNDLLDMSETWVYSADFTIPTPSGDVVNTVTVCSSDSLEQDACDTDEHTTHVYHPMIVVNKEVVTSQSHDDGLFNLQIDGSTAGTGANVGDGGTTGAIVVAPGSHTVGEVAGTDTNLSSYDSSYSCSDEHEGSTISTMVSVSGDNVLTCTFTNVRHASLTVVKQAFPTNSAQSFNFTLSRVNPALEEDTDTPFSLNVSLNQLGGSTLSLVKNFQLDDNTDPTLPNSDTSLLSPGTYEVSEASTDGWDLASMDCGDVNVTKNGSAIRFELTAGQRLTCTFVNQKHVTPQVLGAVTVLTDTGTALLAYAAMATAILGAAIVVIRYRPKLG